MSQSTKTAKSRKSKSDTKSQPKKPYRYFPLTPHPTGCWCKKIRGKIWYFGSWDDPEGALEKHLDQKFRKPYFKELALNEHCSPVMRGPDSYSLGEPDGRDNFA